MRKLYLFVLMQCFLINAQTQNALDIMEEVFNTIEEIQRLEFTLYSVERMHDGKLKENIMQIKMNPSPLTIHINMIKPYKGAELKYDEEENLEKVKVTPPSWWLSWAKLNLKINGKMMRKDMHHSVRETGFGYFADLIKDAQKRAISEKNLQAFKLHGEVQIEEATCYKISIDDPGYSTINYSVKANESILDIARDNYLSEYKIMGLNKNLKDFWDVKTGQKIIIPSSYASRSEIFIDKELMLPIKIEIYNEDGLFERYEFKEVKVNPPESSN